MIRAAITLKLCAYEETGAIVAALTTSIPEAPDSGRNWDYRYCWLRDGYYVVQALNRLGAADILENYLGYLRNIVDGANGGHIQPVYGVGFEPILKERIVDTLAGLSRHGAGAGGQPGARARAARRLWPDRAFQRPGLLRRAPAAAGDRRRLRASNGSASAPSRCTTSRTRGCGNCAPARRCTPIRRRCAGRPATAWRTPADKLGLTARAAALARAGRDRARDHREPRLERERRPLRRHLRRRRARRQPDAAGRPALPAAPMTSATADTLEAIDKVLRRGSNLMRYDTARRFRTPGNRLQLLHVLVHRKPVSDRRDRRGAGAVRTDARSGETTPACCPRTSASTDGELWGNYPQTYSLVGLINCAVLLSRPWTALTPSASGEVAIKDRARRARHEPPDRRLQPRERAGEARRGPCRRPGRGARRRRCANTAASGSAGAARRFRASPARSTRAGWTTSQIVTVDLEEADYQEYYNGYANGTLWPLFHYRIDLTAYERSFGEGYDRVNRRFAETLAPLIEPDDLIWVHDYHLIPLGSELRRLGVANPIGFFLHIPWPAPQLLTTLPRHRAAGASACSPTTWSASRPTNGCGRSRPMCWARRAGDWGGTAGCEAFGASAARAGLSDRPGRRRFPGARRLPGRPAARTTGWRPTAPSAR